MINPKHNNLLVYKAEQLVPLYNQYLYEKICDLRVTFSSEGGSLSCPPKKGYREIKSGQAWGADFKYYWFHSDYIADQTAEGKDLYFFCDNGGVESHVFVNGADAGMLDYFAGCDENVRLHKYIHLEKKAVLGHVFSIDMETYCGNSICGTQPYDGTITYPYTVSIGKRVFKSAGIYTRNENVYNFLLNLKQVISLFKGAEEGGFVRAELFNCFEEIFSTVTRCPQFDPSWEEKLCSATEKLKKHLHVGRSREIPFVGLIGHSHLDSAWLWRLDEGIRKAANTVSNALRLMEEYPEYRFIFSSTLHLEWIKQYYPNLFARVKEKVKTGQFEPNGAAFVECDCNMTGGEAMIRQFLFANRFLKEEFDYHADCYWLPDTFGYSSAIPQIMTGFSIKYFATSKLSWNDTNVFPYDTFIWKGIDGSKVLTHFISIHQWPDAQTIQQRAKEIRVKNVTNGHLLTFGFGDGGGGPSEEMVDMAKLSNGLRDIPCNKMVGVSEFFEKLQQDAYVLPEYAGELYVEGPRGTLTTIHNIKRNNRKLEIALRLAEMVGALTGQDKSKTDNLWKVLLINQFHDILPGSAIPQVHDRSIRETSKAIREADSLALKYLGNNQRSLKLFNSLNWVYDAPFETEKYRHDKSFGKYSVYTDFDGKEKQLFVGANLAPLSNSFVDEKTLQEQGENSSFVFEGNSLKTPFYHVSFNDKGEISSLYDLQAKRELAKSPLNCFYVAEDVPAEWDNWNIDADYIHKLKNEAKLESCEIVADDDIQFRLRNKIRITSKSFLVQDIVFYSKHRRIDFISKLDFQDMHTLLKVGFDLDILSDITRQDTQFGFIEHSTHQNTTYEQAKFEVCNHKWSDLSETNYGVALLNDCKYGISVLNSKMMLTLIKCGTHPDNRGDRGIKYFNYALLPHDGPFGFESVIKEGYMFNILPFENRGKAFGPQINGDFGSVVLESVKLAEKGSGIVLRLYESEKTRTNVSFAWGEGNKEVYECDLAEENFVLIGKSDHISLQFKPFEIKTLYIKEE